MSPGDRAVITSMAGNNVCADCNTPKPDWASVSMGTLICLDCSGTHR